MESIFEGETVNQGTVHFQPAKPTAARPGTQLRSVMQYGTKAYKTYQELYKGQADEIIKGMFAKHKKKMEPIRLPILKLGDTAMLTSNSLL